VRKEDLNETQATQADVRFVANGDVTGPDLDSAGTGSAEQPGERRGLSASSRQGESC
jgi:hypothetical protein